MINNLLWLQACMIVALMAAVMPALADFSACGITSSVAFSTWTKSLQTNVPVVYPRTEADLAKLVKQVSKVPGCKIRVVGTAAAVDGLVALTQDPLVVVVNLADMQTHKKWDNILDAKKAKVRMGAGKTLLDLVSVVRPQGFLPLSRSFGRYFSLGGFYLNPSTHGGSLGADRVSKHVTAARVLTSDGKFKNIQGDALKNWRGSLGLLGIVVALEVKLTKDNGIVQLADQAVFPGPQWNAQNITGFIRNSLQGAEAVHFFYNVYEDKLAGLKTINGADPSFDYAATTAVYDQLHAQYPNLAKEGFPILDLDAILSQLPGGLNNAQIGGAVASQALTAIVGGWQLANTMARDGYVHDVTPSLPINLVEVQIKCQTNCVDDGFTFRALDGLRNILQRTVFNEQWFPTLPIGFRYFTVSKKPAMTLDSLSPGTYMAMELPQAKGVFPLDQYATIFRLVERFLRSLSDKHFPHLGKEYAFGIARDQCQESPGAFQDEEFVHNLISGKVAKQFVSAMNKFDKKKLFRAGAVLHLLDLSNDRFDRRSPLGGTCEFTRDCIDGCCCTHFDCFGANLFNKCVSCNNDLIWG